MPAVGPPKIGQFPETHLMKNDAKGRPIMPSMWWGMSEDWWQQLWSGVIGASVAAGVSVLVAFIVVARTNAHQKHLSDRALAAQEENARTARLLNVRAEVITAAGAVAEANEGLSDAYTAVPAALRHLDSAIIKWQLEADDADFSQEISDFYRLIWHFCYQIMILKDKPEPRREATNHLDALTSCLESLAAEWPRVLDTASVTARLKRLRQDKTPR